MISSDRSLRDDDDDDQLRRDRFTKKEEFLR